MRNLNLKVIQTNSDLWEIVLFDNRQSGMPVGSGSTIEQATADAAINLLRLFSQIRPQSPSPK